VATIASPLTGTTGFTKTGAGTLALAGAGSMSAPTSVLGGVLRVDAAGPLSGSHVTPLAGGTLTIASRLAATIGGLSPNAGGLTDVRDGSMTVASGLAAADLVTALVAGRSGGSWAAASGIASSAVAADVAAGLPRAVGWLDNGDGSLTFAYSAVGDSNLDGLVDVVDAANMLTSGKFNSGGSAVWTEGDFNYDGSFDVLDAADFIAAGSFNAGPYQTTVAEHPAAQVAVVPEPASSAFVAMAAVMGLVLSRGAARRR
jgi:autotransporter-associated beta strand protein